MQTITKKSKKPAKPRAKAKKPSKTSPPSLRPSNSIAIAKCGYCGRKLVVDTERWWLSSMHDAIQHASCDHVVALALAYEVETTIYGNTIPGRFEFEWFTPILVGGGKLLLVPEDEKSVASFVAEQFYRDDNSTKAAQIVRETLPQRLLASGEAKCHALITATAIFSDVPGAFLWCINDDFPGKLILEEE